MSDATATPTLDPVHTRAVADRAASRLHFAAAVFAKIAQRHDGEFQATGMAEYREAADESRGLEAQLKASARELNELTDRIDAIEQNGEVSS